MFSTFLGLLGPIDFDNNWVWLVEKANFAHLQDIWGKVLHTSRDCSIKLFSANRAFFSQFLFNPTVKTYTYFLGISFNWIFTINLTLLEQKLWNFIKRPFLKGVVEDHFTLKFPIFLRKTTQWTSPKKKIFWRVTLEETLSVSCTTTQVLWGEKNFNPPMTKPLLSCLFFKNGRRRIKIHPLRKMRHQIP